MLKDQSTMNYNLLITKKRQTKSPINNSWYVWYKEKETQYIKE